MPFRLNGTEIDDLRLNGVQVENAYFNGVHVYERLHPVQYLTYYNNTIIFDQFNSYTLLNRYAANSTEYLIGYCFTAGPQANIATNTTSYWGNQFPIYPTYPMAVNAGYISCYPSYFTEVPTIRSFVTVKLGGVGSIKHIDRNFPSTGTNVTVESGDLVIACCYTPAGFSNEAHVTVTGGTSTKTYIYGFNTWVNGAYASCKIYAISVSSTQALNINLYANNVRDGGVIHFGPVL